MYFLIFILSSKPLASSSITTRKLLASYVELKNPIEPAVTLNKERVVIRCGLYNAWRFGDAFAAPALGCSLS